MFIDAVVIDTDSDNIKKDADKFFGDHITILDRPKALYGDFISMNSIIEYDLSNLLNYNHFIQTHSTNPLLNTKTVDNAIQK